MKIIKTAIIKILRWASQHDASISCADEPKTAYNSTLGSNRHGPDTVGMNFTVFNAIGGKVIQINQYNPVNDRTRQQLYIVTDNEDLGVELGQIITIESLNR